MALNVETLTNIGIGASIAANIIAYSLTVLPPGKPGTVWGTVRTALDFIGANFGNAKNQPKA